MFAKSGDTVAPCGEPTSVAVHRPCSMPPALNHFWTSRTNLRCSTNFASHPWSMASKKPRHPRVPRGPARDGRHHGVFPLWRHDTRALAHEMLSASLRATTTCVDPCTLKPSFAGRTFDTELLAALHQVWIPAARTESSTPS